MSRGLVTFNEDLVFHQGATFDDTYTWEADAVAIDLTGCTAKMQVRTAYGAAAAVVTIDTAGGGIVLGGTAGTIRIVVADDVTLALATGDYVYDLHLFWGDGTTEKIMRGAVSVLPGVTA